MKPNTSFTHTEPWWKRTTVYQIYPRSFQDSNSDGIGDLQGIRSRLDHIHQTGFETIWISPFFQSPQKDLGYDISDYYKIAPEYGTMDDFRQLIDDIHRRDMKLVLDMVLNHTSDQHSWFRESCSGRDNPKRDWYVWRDGRKPDGKIPPNNWTSLVTGSGWHYHPPTEQWYWASFLPFQPDLNFRNPEVKQAMFEMMRFWLREGVDGFRLDIIGAVYEDAEFRDNPRSWRLFPSDDGEGFLFRSNRMTQNHPDNFGFSRELRSLVDEFSDPPRFLVGETFGPMRTLREYCGASAPDGLNLAFLFETMKTPFRAPALRRLIGKFEEHFPPPFMPTYVFSNHDKTRRFTRLGGSPEKAKLNTLLQFTVRGVPFTYYGEEIGMRQGKIPPKESRDAVAHHMGTKPAWKIKILNRITGGSVQRDGCRTPMQWNSEEWAGFISGGITGGGAGFISAGAEPWLPVNSDYPEVNVKKQMEDPASLLQCYRRLLSLRSQYPALQYGEMTLLQAPQAVLAYTRTVSGEVELEKETGVEESPGPKEENAHPKGKPESGGPSGQQKILVLLNLSRRPSPRIPIDSRFSRLYSTRDGLAETEPRPVEYLAGETLRLRPWEGIILLEGSPAHRD